MLSLLIFKASRVWAGWQAVLENGSKYDWGPEQAVPSEAAALLRQGYYAAVSYVDEQVGKILAELEALKMHSTIVAFTSDRA